LEENGGPEDKIGHVGGALFVEKRATKFVMIVGGELLQGPCEKKIVGKTFGKAKMLKRVRNHSEVLAAREKKEHGIVEKEWSSWWPHDLGRAKAFGLIGTPSAKGFGRGCLIRLGSGGGKSHEIGSR